MWIVDRHPVHRSKLVQQWLHNHRDQIEKSFLPPYLPQLNPAEYLNCDVKQGVHFFATYPQLDSVKRVAAVTSIQTTKVTCSNRQLFPASIHCLCCLNRCNLNYCQVNKLKSRSKEV